jgi:hypothetical protein
MDTSNFDEFEELEPWIPPASKGRHEGKFNKSKVGVLANLSKILDFMDLLSRELQRIIRSSIS